MRAYSKKDVDRKALKGARIAILGYGSQGRAHALNLKDSGYDVVVGVRRTGDSWKKAKKDGLAVAEPAEAVKGAALVGPADAGPRAAARLQGDPPNRCRRAPRCCSRTASTSTSGRSSRARISTSC